MDANQLRNRLAPMTRGTTLTLPHVEHKLEVVFTEEGFFFLKSATKEGKLTTLSPGFKSVANFTQHLMQFFVPKPGHIFQHINGNIYTVLHIANELSLRSEYPPSVVYQGPNDKVWVKSMDNFMYKMNRIK